VSGYAANIVSLLESASASSFTGLLYKSDEASQPGLPLFRSARLLSQHTSTQLKPLDVVPAGRVQR
jgi:hypothetical protein